MWEAITEALRLAGEQIRRIWRGNDEKQERRKSRAEQLDDAIARGDVDDAGNLGRRRLRDHETR